MTEKKQYVLWVVHTTLRDPPHTELTEADRRVLEEEYGRVLERVEPRAINEMFFEGIAEAIKIAQQAETPVIYECDRGGEEFLAYLSNKGIDRSKVHIIGRTAGIIVVPAFVRKVEELGITDFEVIFVGHYAESCIWVRADLLKERCGIISYLVRGTTRYQRAMADVKFVQEFFGDRRITLEQLRSMLNRK